MRLHRISVCMLVLLIGAAALTPLPAGAQPPNPTPRGSAQGAGATFVGEHSVILTSHR